MGITTASHISAIAVPLWNSGGMTPETLSSRMVHDVNGTALVLVAPS
jgi:hypothetical protein